MGQTVAAAMACLEWGVGLVLLIAGLAIGCGGKGDGDVEIGSRFTIVDGQGTGEVYRRYRVTG